MTTMCEKLKQIIIEQSAVSGMIPGELEEMMHLLGHYKLITDEEYQDLMNVADEIEERRRAKSRKLKEERAKIKVLQRELEDRLRALNEQEFDFIP